MPILSQRALKGLGAVPTDFSSYAAATAATLPQTDPNTSLTAYLTSGRGLVQDVAQGLGFKGDRLAEFVRSMKETQDGLDLAYNRVQIYKQYPQAAITAGVSTARLEAFQQEGYVKFQIVLFWAQMIPYVHDALKAAGVRPADYVTAVANDAIIRAFAYWADIDGSYATLRANGQLRGLGELPAIPVIVGICVVSIALAWAAVEGWRQIMITWRDSSDKEAQKPLVACVAAGGAPAAQCKAALDALVAGSAEREKGAGDPTKGLTSMLMWVAVIGAGVVFLPTLMAAGRAGASQIEARYRQPAAVAGLRRRRLRRIY